MIEISVLNSKLEKVAVFDKYKSFIWTDRYNEAGEFELNISVTTKYANIIKKDMFVTIPTSDRMMVIETIKTETDNEEGNFYNITGRSLESILDRRIVWKQTAFNSHTPVQDAIYVILSDSIINPSDSRRRIDNFVFEPSSEEEILNKQYLRDSQYMGDSVYEVVKKVCQSNHIGFKIEVNSSNEFVFSLYVGENKSYNQSSDSYVVFSPSHDNLLNSNYLESIKNYKNVLRIAGEGEGATQTFITHYVEFDNDKASEKTGLERREIYVDCHDVSSVIDGNVVMDVGQYTNTLVQKGVEKMLELVPETAFDGEVDSTIMFKYNTDFKVGDICEIRNEYGNGDQVRITEVVQSWEPDGYTCVPTLESLTKENLELLDEEEEAKKYVETVETAIDEITDPKLRVVWSDSFGGREDYKAEYVDFSDVKLPTQLMVIKYLLASNEWKITFREKVDVKNVKTGTVTVYHEMATLIWSYSDVVSYEIRRHKG